ncbi:uncharacterized calcium-binding protein B0563.7 isoform X1 [Drosophila serrata]|uniref:uncharacterized calcium-binding protein B0563.7 isoform X1 n=1 Tax=Drosophila serrata TaxID=7274 RepID=UPI000A1D104D|nr:uncharacterized calcium-binding protein B0563.7 isoform X1 [Drosophila serrata]XP_020802633.1 uncharacterized calcium-binding protein B0563.7 isoform X1 [Drosophila serrata]XP_020802634.1 uncharacterized calcium-binding protein B0563.7 isoform X1 [Drosophila serrata]
MTRNAAVSGDEPDEEHTPDQPLEGNDQVVVATQTGSGQDMEAGDSHATAPPSTQQRRQRQRPRKKETMTKRAVKSSSSSSKTQRSAAMDVDVDTDSSSCEGGTRRRTRVSYAQRNLKEMGPEEEEHQEEQDEDDYEEEEDEDDDEDEEDLGEGADEEESYDDYEQSSRAGERHRPPVQSTLSVRSRRSKTKSRQISYASEDLELGGEGQYPMESNESQDKRRCISKGQMREFREAFRLFDKDGDGCITKEELGTVMRSLGQFARVEELQEMLQEIDVDGDGNVSFEEFVDILSNMTYEDKSGLSSADQEERELRDAFRVFDKHNRGYITASDLRAVLQCLGEDLDEEDIEDMIKEVDVDGDGRIDFYEFVHALGEPEDSQENDDEEENTTSPLPTPKSAISLTYD